MDQRHILCKARLELSPDIKGGPTEGDFLILKNEPTRTYLTVTREQWRILQRFRGGSTVASILPLLITERACPPLKELYELILKAVQEEILTEGEGGKERVRAIEWNYKLTWVGATWIGCFCFLFGVAGLSYRGPMEVPANVFDLVGGYLLALIALSIGQVLGACLLSDCDCEVYNPYLHWKTLLPHLHFDLDDEVMGGRLCRVGVELSRMAPLFFVTGMCAFGIPRFDFVLVLGIFWVISPFGEAPARRILKALFDEMHLSTGSNFLFQEYRLIRERLNTPLQTSNSTYTVISLFYTLAWLVSISTWAIHTFNLEAIAVSGAVGEFMFRKGVLFATSAALCALVVGFLVYHCWKPAVDLFKETRERFQSKEPAIKPGPDMVIPHQRIVDLLSSSLLFRELKLEVVEEIAKSVKHRVVKARGYVMNEGDEGNTLFIVFSGRVEVLRDTKTGRPERVSLLGPGEVFGEVALIHQIPRNRSVRAARTSILLTVSQEIFDRVLLEHMPSQKVEEIIQKRAFLHRIPLCREWSDDAITRFAQLSVLNNYPIGDTVLPAGMFNQFFYIVYDGLLDVDREGKRLARLGIGDFFGEISIMQNSVSVADVVAKKETRCISIYRNEFLRFLGEDYAIALYFERISSRRLKHPIFPLS